MNVWLPSKTYGSDQGTYVTFENDDDLYVIVFGCNAKSFAIAWVVVFYPFSLMFNREKKVFLQILNFISF